MLTNPPVKPWLWKHRRLIVAALFMLFHWPAPTLARRIENSVWSSVAQFSLFKQPGPQPPAATESQMKWYYNIRTVRTMCWIQDLPRWNRNIHIIHLMTSSLALITIWSQNLHCCNITVHQGGDTRREEVLSKGFVDISIHINSHASVTAQN